MELNVIWKFHWMNIQQLTWQSPRPRKLKRSGIPPKVDAGFFPRVQFPASFRVKGSRWVPGSHCVSCPSRSQLTRIHRVMFLSSFSEHPSHSCSPVSGPVQSRRLSSPIARPSRYVGNTDAPSRKGCWSTWLTFHEGQATGRQGSISTIVPAIQDSDQHIRSAFISEQCREGEGVRWVTHHAFQWTLHWLISAQALCHDRGNDLWAHGSRLGFPWWWWRGYLRGRGLASTYGIVPWQCRVTGALGLRVPFRQHASDPR
jgi:hypothetical protein